MSKLPVNHNVWFRLVSPESRHHLTPPGGGQRGKQLLIFTEHQHIPEAGVGQSCASSTHTEQIIAEDHCSSHWHCGAFWEGLIYAGEK